MLEEVSGYLKEIVVNHLVHDLRLMDQLIQSLECIAAPAMIQVLLNEHLPELGDHSIEDGNRDLLRFDVRGEWLL